MKPIKFGIASVAEQRERALAIASGKRKRSLDEPAIWFPSISAVAKVLSSENMALLKYIKESHPESVRELAVLAGKQEPNVSRSLHTMAEYGLVRLVKTGRTVKPEVAASEVSFSLDF
jgi:predicted transcriptional regulator